ncbi:cytochrome p450 domain-containing protein [Ditylenchus destructor]|nr:cytochrome p450 domain-containing protein [Ditylenchus destructor]
MPVGLTVIRDLCTTKPRTLSDIMGENILGKAIDYKSAACYNVGYWKRYGINGPIGKPFVGSLGEWWGGSSVFKLREWTKQYGKVYGIQEGWRHVLIVSDINMLQELFVKKFEYFHGRKIMPIVENSTHVMMEFLDEAYEKGKSFNIHPYFHELTMDIISRIAMGQKGSLQFRSKNAVLAKQVFARTPEFRGMERMWISLTCFWRSKEKLIKTTVTRHSIGLRRSFDTTANTLANTCFLLAHNPDAQQRLQQEIDDICPEGDPSYEQLNQLRYADATMKEALRLHPIAALWLEESQTNHLMAWFPFGAGPRTCIGLRLAYLEEKLALVHILRKYNLVRTAETEKELKMVGSTILNPESVTVKLELRSPS